MATARFRDLRSLLNANRNIETEILTILDKPRWNPRARVPNNIKLRLKVSRGAVAKNRGAALTSDDLVNWDAWGNRNKI